MQEYFIPPNELCRQRDEWISLKNKFGKLQYYIFGRGRIEDLCCKSLIWMTLIGFMVTFQDCDLQSKKKLRSLKLAGRKEMEKLEPAHLGRCDSHHREGRWSNCNKSKTLWRKQICQGVSIRERNEAYKSHPQNPLVGGTYNVHLTQQRVPHV